ncbi:MAG TPA: hypothetical protein VES93_14540 [Ornithinibacter sp.]|nr:hypothetical protein [Ornithinibacter sp.]
MRVVVAITPPEHVVDDVEAALDRTPVPPGEFSRVPAVALMMPMFSLGNVTRPEVRSVADSLTAELDRSRPAATVGLAGVWALETEGDPTVGLPLVGEVDRVGELASSLWSLVARHGYFVDRRRWVARLTIGSVTSTTSLPFLERLVADLDRYASPTWQVSSVSLVRQRFDTAQASTWDVLERVPTVVDPT